jgi:acetoin utilization protein AcuC
MHWAAEEDRTLALAAVEKSILRVKKTIFPGILGSHGNTSL